MISKMLKKFVTAFVPSFLIVALLLFGFAQNSLAVAGPIPVDITISNLSQTYNGNQRVVTISTDPPDVSISVTYNQSQTPPTLPGTYDVVASVSDIESYSGSASATLVINPAPLNVFGISTQDKIYDGTTTASLFIIDGVRVGGAFGDDSVSVDTEEMIGTFDNKNVGTEKTVTISGLTLTGAQASNYTITSPTTLANITQASTTVTANSASKNAGAGDPALAYTGTLFPGDSFSGNLTRNEGEAVGTYAISQGTLSAGSNYLINFVGGTFTITEAAPAPAQAPAPAAGNGAPGAGGGMPLNAQSPRLQTIYPDGRIVYLDEPGVGGSIGGQVLGAETFKFNKNLYKGLRHNDVTELQNRLTKEGVYTGPVTGYFGKLTEAAVKVYQGKKKIEQGGIVGPKTRGALNAS